jgi:hypothetical protein
MNNNIHNKPSKLATVDKRIFLALITCGMCLLHNEYSYAQVDSLQSETLKSIRSIKVDYTDKAPKLAQGKYDLLKNDAQEAATQDIEALTFVPLERKTRDQVMAERRRDFVAKAEAINTSSKSLSTQNTDSGEYLQFSIYDASSRLFDDTDYDGFFRTFSVSFDADVFGPYSGQRARVYADLYLSRNGGPWELYFTTAPFTIIDDISDDEFEVLTTLDSGYATQYYDVLIDLYEVGYSDIVATISSDDVDALYALPLESADRDEYEQVVSSTSVQISAGSLSVYAMGMLFFVGIIRNLRSLHS